MKEGKPVKGNTKMSCERLKEVWKGEFDFKESRRIGKGVLTENGKEYFVEYFIGCFEEEISRKRTFEGIRLMIIGNR